MSFHCPIFGEFDIILILLVAGILYLVAQLEKSEIKCAEAPIEQGKDFNNNVSTFIILTFVNDLATSFEWPNRTYTIINFRDN